jgi:hypothetical protein
MLFDTQLNTSFIKLPPFTLAGFDLTQEDFLNNEEIENFNK